LIAFIDLARIANVTRRTECLNRRRASGKWIKTDPEIHAEKSTAKNKAFLDRKNALARLLRNTESGILFNEHIAKRGAVVFAHACGPGAEGIGTRPATPLTYSLRRDDSDYVAFCFAKPEECAGFCQALWWRGVATGSRR
jgi:hypothetical protein